MFGLEYFSRAFGSLTARGVQTAACVGSDGKPKALPSASDSEGGFSFGFMDGEEPPQTQSESSFSFNFS